MAPSIKQPDIDLYTRAKDVLDESYSPYSNFAVGAAVRSAEGEVFTGVNVENASYGLSMCAERTAVFKAISEGKQNLASLAVAAEDDQPASPCGACRQVMHEFNSEMRVIYGPTQKNLTVRSLAEMIPDSFGPDSVQSPSD
ncbi:MAG: cytidine deaminase [bacterium]